MTETVSAALFRMTAMTVRVFSLTSGVALYTHADREEGRYIDGARLGYGALISTHLRRDSVLISAYPIGKVVL